MRAAAQAPFLKLGIYGGVPNPASHRGQLVAAHLLQLDPPVGGPLKITVPLNGLLNYSFYYAPTATPGVDKFLPAGFYAVSYLDKSGNSTFAGAVFYQPNAHYTNGVQVPHNPPNPSPSATQLGPLGIHGIVTRSVGPMSGQPVQGEIVDLFSPDLSRAPQSRPTNGDGFYSFYYTSGKNDTFIQPGPYDVAASMFNITEVQSVTYDPNTDPTSIGYYVLGASDVVDFNFAEP